MGGRPSTVSHTSHRWRPSQACTTFLRPSSRVLDEHVSTVKVAKDSLPPASSSTSRPPPPPMSLSSGSRAETAWPTTRGAPAHGPARGMTAPHVAAPVASPATIPEGTSRAAGGAVSTAEADTSACAGTAGTTGSREVATAPPAARATAACATVALSAPTVAASSLCPGRRPQRQPIHANTISQIRRATR